jgi:hypothetical protein
VAARLAAALGAGIAAVLLLPVTASAETSTGGLGCIATVAGQDIAGHSSDDLGSAITVDAGSATPVSMFAASEISRYSVNLEYLGRGDDVVGNLLRVAPSWSAAAGTPAQLAWSDTLPVQRYARFGTGVFRAVIVGQGPNGQCIARALIRIDGDPMRSAAGLISMVTAIMAATLMLAAIGLAAVEDPLRRRRRREAASGPTPEAKARAHRQVHWRPRFSVMGITGGVFGAASVLAVLQEYGRFYPTTAVAYRAVLVGVGVGIVVPSLARILAVRRANRRLADRILLAVAEAPLLA